MKNDPLRRQNQDVRESKSLPFTYLANFLSIRTNGTEEKKKDCIINWGGELQIAGPTAKKSNTRIFRGK